jgi:hypothetical protein
MKPSPKFCLFALLFVLTLAPLHAGERNQEQEKLDTDFFKAASSEIPPHEKYKQLSSLLNEKADIATMGQSLERDPEKFMVTALSNLMHIAYIHRRDENKSIKLLIDSGSPLNSWDRCCAPLRIAIQGAMLPVISMLVDAKVDVNLLPSPANEQINKATYLHAIAWSRSKTDEASTSIFDTLSKLGNVPVDDLNNYDVPAIHLSRIHKKPNLTRRLLAYGANPYCPISIECPDSGCHQNDDANTKAVHQEWKTEATKRVLEKIPVTPLGNIVMNYCFCNPRDQN